MGFIKRHPVAFLVLGFFLITLPSGVDAWLSLWERTPTGKFGDIDWTGNIAAIDWLQMVPLLGIFLFLFVLHQTWKS